MEKDALVEIIKKRLALEGEELAAVLDNPKYQRLFENAAKGSRYRLVAEIVASKGCQDMLLGSESSLIPPVTY